MVSRAVFLALVAVVAMQRLVELRRSARNEASLRRRGAVERAAGQMPWMRAIHALWLVGCVAEVLLVASLPPLWVTVVAGVAFVVGQGLRLSAMRALGRRWTVRVLVLPGAPPVSRGVFRVLRHPNYLGVALEIAALPAVHGAWITAITFSIANGLLMRRRIRAEERALARIGRGYPAAFAGAAPGLAAGSR